MAKIIFSGALNTTLECTEDFADKLICTVAREYPDTYCAWRYTSDYISEPARGYATIWHFLYRKETILPDGKILNKEYFKNYRGKLALSKLTKTTINIKCLD